jgi:hypothetical protein
MMRQAAQIVAERVGLTIEKFILFGKNQGID